MCRWHREPSSHPEGYVHAGTHALPYRFQVLTKISHSSLPQTHSRPNHSWWNMHWSSCASLWKLWKGLIRLALGTSRKPWKETKTSRPMMN